MIKLPQPAWKDVIMLFMIATPVDNTTTTTTTTTTNNNNLSSDVSDLDPAALESEKHAEHKCV